MSDHTLRDAFCLDAARALASVPVDTPALAVNALLRQHFPERTARNFEHYSSWRRAVRAVQRERARWCEWEGRSAAGVACTRRPGRERKRRTPKAA